MGCTQSTAASPQPDVQRSMLMSADALAGPESAINDFCYMARASSPASSETTAASRTGSAIDEFCKLAVQAAPAGAQKVRQPSTTHAASVADNWSDTLGNADVVGVPPCGEDHQVRTASESSRASVSTAASACSRVSARSSRQAGADTFPEKVMSLDSISTSFRVADFEFDTAVDGQRLSGWSLKTSAVGSAAHRFLAPQLQGSEKHTIRGYISEPHHITFSDRELRELRIDGEARHFAFSYPVVTSEELKASAKEQMQNNMAVWASQMKDTQVADIAFLIFGGYMYFDADMVLMGVRAIVPSDEGCLHFGPPQQWLPQWTAAAGPDRWRPVTLPALRALGARYFSWLRPGESVEGEALCRHGGFAYIFHEPSESGTLQAQLDVFFQLADAQVDHGKCCPQCGDIMQWSDYDEGAYAGGWACEYVGACGQARTSEEPMRWFCADCEIDICGSCAANAVPEDRTRSPLHG